MPPPQDNARVFLLIIILFWLTSSPDTGPGLISGPGILSARLKRQRAAHGVLNGTKWGDFAPSARDSPDGTAKFLNLTGFREGDGYAWADLDRFRQRCLQFSRSANPGRRAVAATGGPGDEDAWDWDLARAPPTWQNATGVVNGQWVRRDGSEARASAHYNLTELAPATSWASHEWSRNITGHEGKILLRVDDKPPPQKRGPRQWLTEFADTEAEGQVRTGGLVRAVSATASIEDATGTGSTHDVRLHGVHWPRQGAMLLTTTSDKFSGIFGLPHLTPGVNFFRSSQHLLNATTDEVLRRKEKARFADLSNPWSSSPNVPQETWNPAPHCEYVMWLQVHPLDTVQLLPRPLPLDAGADAGADADAVNDGLTALIRQIEDELRFPTGAPTHAGLGGAAAVPELRMSAVVYSPDCAFFLESKGPPDFAAVDLSADGSPLQHLVGMKDEAFAHTAKMWLLAFAAVMFSQVQLLKTQMRESSTPSTVGRISFWTAGAMVMADGLVFGASSFWSLSASATFLPSLLLTFAAFVSMSIGGSFLYEVYKVQEPERRNRDRDQGPAAPASAAAAAGAAAATRNPPPSTATAPARPQTPPIIIPSDQDIDAEIMENTTAGAAAVPQTGPILPTTNPNATTTTTTIQPQQQQPTPFSAVLGRFLLVGLMLLFTSLAATAWWARARAVYVNGLLFVYLSLWVPQIVRNVRRNSRRAFSWRFMAGQSALRLLPVAYFYLRERNIAFARPDREAFLMLVAWVWCQLWVLAFQDVLGPRFGLPRAWLWFKLPEAWDYHPVLREDALEAGALPVGLMGDGLGDGKDSAPGSPVAGRHRRRRSSLGSVVDDDDRGSGGDDKHTRIRCIDCAICREVLEVPVVRAGHSDPTAGGVAGVFARRQYMVTPCRHIFHSACLEGWLRFRLQCPICREDLPPL